MKNSLLIAFIFLSLGIMAQNTASVDVNKDIAITKVYEQVIKEGYGTPKVYLDLANAYYFEGNYKKAKQWYEKLFESQPTKKEIVLFRYKQSLKALKLSPEKNKYLAKVPN